MKISLSHKERVSIRDIAQYQIDENQFLLKYYSDKYSTEQIDKMKNKINELNILKSKLKLAK